MIKKQKEITLKDVYEPSEIKEKMLTENDELIRIRDIPERFQATDSYIPEDAEISREASIVTKLFQKDKPETSEKVLNTAITAVLKFLRRENLEVPFIYRHRRDYFDGILSLQDIWRIVELDEKFVAVELKKKSLGELILEISSIEPLIEQDLQLQKFIEKIVTQDDVKDTFAYIHLIYSAQVEKLKSTVIHRRIFKKAPWKVLYDDAISNGLKKFTELYDIKMANFVQSITGQQSLHFPEDPDKTPMEAAKEYICPRFPTAESVLDAARTIVAQEIAVQPELLAFIRLVFNSDAVVSVEPTEKGISEIEFHHPCSVIIYLTFRRSSILKRNQYINLLMDNFYNS
jgi:transcription elongation factor SPT6